jgi:hypothetical protein
MIGSLLYLTATRPDIQFSVCLCARFQASPRTSHWQAVNRIFRYLRHTPDFGLWYSASSFLALHGFSDADFAGCRLDRKSTFGTCQFLGSSLVLLGNSGKPITLETLSLTKFLRHVFQGQETHDFQKPGTCEAPNSRMYEVRGS